jgi:hypothetical protein
MVVIHRRPQDFRVNDELQRRFREVVEASGVKNNAELLEAMITAYSLERAKDESTALAPAITAINSLMGRINTVLIGATEQIATEKEQQAINQQKAMARLEEQLSKSIEQMETLQAELEHNTSVQVIALTDKINEMTLQHEKDLLEQEKRLNAEAMEGYKSTFNRLIAQLDTAGTASTAISQTEKQ